MKLTNGTPVRNTGVFRHLHTASRQRDVLKHIARGFEQSIQCNGLIWSVCHGYYRITEAGRKAMEAQQ